MVKFIKILNSKLEYNLTRKEAQMMTFNEFIEKESADETEYHLKPLFEEFALGWNSVINYIFQYQSKELPSDKPYMDLELPIIFGLVEQKDTGIYICAILEFLIQSHNEFLDNVLSIPVGQCKNLNFMEQSTWNNLTSKTYHIKSIKVIQAQEINFINYEWNEKILKYSQRNPEQKALNFMFDLQKIERILVKELVLNKVYFEKEDNQFYLKDFSFKHELFHNSLRILSDIKKLLPQEPIPMDKLAIVLSLFQPTNSFILDNSLDLMNLSELCFLFEIIFSFIKELSINNKDILIIDFISQWLKLVKLAGLERLSNINTGFINIFEEFSLNHIVKLYELIEEQVANSIIHNINFKFKIPLTQPMKESINNCINYGQENQNQQLIPAKEFALALKRFIYRFLLIDSNIENLNLNIYFLDFTLNLWESEIKEELVNKLFPTCLLVSNAYNSYTFIVDEIEVCI